MILVIRGAAYPLGIAGGLLFWFGDRALHAFAKFSFFGSELVSMSLAVVLLGLAAIAKHVADDLEIEDAGGPATLGEALRQVPTPSSPSPESNSQIRSKLL
jgi:hypothetical protein